MFWLTDASLVTALNGPYGALCLALAGLIAACIGIQQLAPATPYGGKREAGDD